MAAKRSSGHSHVRGMTIVEITFAHDADGKLVRDAPFMVRGDGTTRFYEDEPGVLGQIDDNPLKAYFEAESKADGQRSFGRSVTEKRVF